MLKKALLLSFILLVFPFFLKGEEGPPEDWQTIEPPQSYSYLLEAIFENLPAIRFDTEEHRNEYQNELQTTINLALEGNLDAVKERIFQIHIPQTENWIVSEIQKKIVLILLKSEFYIENGASLYIPPEFQEEIKNGIAELLIKIRIRFGIHFPDCTEVIIEFEIEF